MPTVADITAFLDRFAPPALAAEWDNVGLLLGAAAAPVRSIMTCLTVTPESAGEAVEAGVSVVVSHHPILFRPTKRLTSATAEGRVLLDLARADVAVYSPHTAFDNCAGGINDLLAQRLGLSEVTALCDQAPRGADASRQCKLVVFVPDQDLAEVADALFSAGAGHIGQYSQCSFRLAGTGTFFGSDAANPSVGQKGRREEVGEWRLEAVCPEAALPQALAALRRAHSYEEPAFDIYPLRHVPNPCGAGRLGVLPQALPLSALAANVKDRLAAACVQMVGIPDRPVQRVAIVCGSGGDFVSAAVAKKADVLVTGEARFHDCLAAQAQGLCLLLPGHYATERLGVEHLADILQRQFSDITTWASRCEADPLRLAPLE
jgi:dinuclear metal center YbgI/SA1388 family protein